MKPTTQTDTAAGDELNHSPEGLGLGESLGSPFSWQLKTNDGSDPIHCVQDQDGSMIYQGESVVGCGPRLIDAWNDYIYPLSPDAAPVNDDDLSEMWAAYDGQTNLVWRNGDVGFAFYKCR